MHLLPLLEEHELYQQFRLDEDWDSTHNQALIAKMPAVFLSAASKLDPASGHSSFIAPVGEHRIIGLKTPRRVRDILDGTSRTICLLEVDDTAAEIWTKPATEATDTTELVNHLGTLHQKRFVISLGDAQTLTLRSDIPPESLEKLIRIDDHRDEPNTNEYELRKRYRAR